MAIKGLDRNNLYEYLRDNKIIMTDIYEDKHGKDKAGIKHYEAFSKYANSQQYFEHRTRNAQMGYKAVKQSVAMFTAKGVEWIVKRLQKDGYIEKKALESVVAELESKLVA